MMVGGGTADTMDLRRRGIKVELGCDGSASTNHSSLWPKTRIALLLGRIRNGPHSMTARDALDVATRGGACADLVMWHVSPVAQSGALSDPVEAIIRCAPATAWYTLVNGQVIVENSQPCQRNLKDRLSAHKRAARRMQKLE